MTNLSRTIWLGAVAYDPKAVTIWEAIKEYFVESRVPFDFVLFSNYEAQVEALFDRKIDIAWNTPVAYVRCEHRLEGKSRTLAMRDTDVGFTSKFITRRDSGIRSLADLRGKRFAIGSRDSAQAAILPYHHLTHNGLVPGSDVEIVRFDTDLGKHGDTGTSELDVLRAVQSGAADAGAIGDAIYIQLMSGALTQLGEFRAFYTSPPFSHCNFTALPDIDPQLADSFTRTLLAMDYANPKHKRAMDLEGLKRWVPCNKDGYADLTEAMKTQGML
jgi:ABC-type phosphate/phosphonate transport system substrate-binding protein